LRQAVGHLVVVSALINLGAAAYVIYRDPRRLENRLFATLALLLCLTCVGEYLAVAGSGAAAVLAGSRICHTLWLLLAPVYVHFTMEVAGWPGKGRRALLAALYSVCIATAVLTASTGLVVRAVEFVPGAINMNHQVGGPLWYLATLLSGLTYTSGIAILMFAGRPGESRPGRTARGILILATWLPVAAMGISYLLLPLFGVRVPMGYSFFTPFLALFVAYAVTRYDLMTTVGSRIGSTLVSGIEEAVVLVGDQGAIELANEAAVRLLGRAAGELEGRRLDELVLDYAQDMQPAGEAVMAVVMLEDGSPVPVTRSVSPISSRRGTLLGSVVILHDMREAFSRLRAEREAREAELKAESEWRRAESLERARRELRERNEFLQMVLDNMIEPVFIKDTEFRYIYVNEAFAEFVGKDRESMLDRRSLDLFDIDAESRLVRSDSEAFETGSVVVIEEPELTADDGSRGAYRALKAPVMGADGKPEYLIGVVQDLTQQKLLEKARLDFVRIAAHELRTPLTSLKLAAEMLERQMGDRMDEREARALEVMTMSLQRLILLARNLLDLASLDAGTIQLKLSPVAVGPFIREVVSTLQYELDGKRLSVAIDCPEEIAPVEADPARLWQVLANLLSNSIKFTDEGEIRIAARESDGAVEFSVADTGCGIDKEYLETIFSRFSKAQDVPSARSGTGLGLSIARGIVEAHGGEIWCESEPGNGARFHFTVRKAGRERPGG